MQVSHVKPQNNVLKTLLEHFYPTVFIVNNSDIKYVKARIKDFLVAVVEYAILLYGVLQMEHQTHVLLNQLSIIYVFKTRSVIITKGVIISMRLWGVALIISL